MLIVPVVLAITLLILIVLLRSLLIPVLLVVTVALNFLAHPRRRLARLRAPLRLQRNGGVGTAVRVRLLGRARIGFVAFGVLLDTLVGS